MRTLDQWIAVTVRQLIRFGLGVYFSRIERFHAERVPVSGPVLFVSNHPGSITDAFLIGTAVKRRVGFVGTVQLFRWQPLARMLRACGIIPVNRVKDDPRAMRTVIETFEACYRVLEEGGAVGIFPEGVTYNDARMRPVKSGTARMALELEHRHEGKLGLYIVPVGISYSHKNRYRSRVLLQFGEPLRPADWLVEYGTKRKQAIQHFSQEVEQRIQALILHLPGLERARLVKAVACLYLDPVRFPERRPTSQADELAVTQRIAAVIDHLQRDEPNKVAAFAQRLSRYQRRLRSLKLAEETVGELGRRPARQLLAGAFRLLLAVLGFPLALYGWVHRWLPALLVERAVRRLTARGARKAQTPHVTMLAGLVAFSVAYSVYVGLVHSIWGWPVSGYYALSLPVAGLYAYAYFRWVIHLPFQARALLLRLQAPWTVRRLMHERALLVREIEASAPAAREAETRDVPGSTG